MIDRLPSIPILKLKEVQQRADSFRRQHTSDGTLPLDIEAITESLNIHIQPVRGLSSLAGVDALITSDFKIVYLDQGQYEHSDGSYDNRLRFSMAHELAHFYLHRAYYNNLGIKSVDDVLRFFAQMSEDDYRWLEWQSNEFAGRLLVPPDALAVCMREVLKRYRRELLNQKFGAKELLTAMAPNIGVHFGVSGDVIVRRQNIEKTPDYFGTGFDRGDFTLNMQKLTKSEELTSDWSLPSL